jgi:hypothetical protein
MTLTHENLLREAEIWQERSIANEEFILEYMSLPWWKRLFSGRKPLIEHLIKVYKKYENEPF